MENYLTNIKSFSCLCLLFLLTSLSNTNSFGQTVGKSTMSVFHSATSNDSLIVTAGQSMSGESNSPRILHGYLPLQYSQLNITEFGDIEVSVYPNPTNGIVYIELSISDNIDLKIFDATGRELLVDTFSDSYLQLDLSTYADGLYYIELLSNNERIAFKKLIVQ